MNHLYVLVLCGGSGTRLWPVSREDTPKQFAKLFSGQSLFEMTLNRALKVTSPDHIFVSTAEKYLNYVKKHTKTIPAENIIGEPIRRDTALAIGVASAYIFKKDPEAVVINMASDHLIKPQSVFVDQVKKVASIVEQQKLIATIGIKPSFPHTGLGHIYAPKEFPGLNDPSILLGEKFIEKPPFELAQKYTESGKYFWNTNLYIFPVKSMLDSLKKFSPKIYAFLPKLIQSIGTDREKQVFKTVFQMSPSLAIDYAVSEKLPKLIFVPAKFSWTDVGDWNEVWKNLAKDSQGNVIEGTRGKGEYIGINSRNNLLFLDKKIVVTVGIQDVLIVDTPDALLVCPKNDAQGVKQAVTALKDQELDKYL